MKLKIISNFRNLAGLKTPNCDVDLYPYFPSGIAAVVAIFVRSFKYDYILLNGSPSMRAVLILAFLKWLVPFHRTRIVVVDILLPKPTTMKNRAMAAVIGLAFRKVHLVVLYYRDTNGIRRYYRIPERKFRYVPFKINQIDLVRATQSRDEGYIFCGGKTRRDFRTFFDAVRDLKYPVKVVTTDNADIIQHGSFLDDNSAPPNVGIIRLDGNAKEFISYMANSRLVVLPIIPDICGAGIGVYIMAMALKKCVIISAGPGAEDVLPREVAVVVPPNDPGALRMAIVRAFEDPTYRRSYEENGYRYATSLDGEERLLRSIVDELYRDATGGGSAGN